MKILWTDGSASPNPGPGGYAVICDGQPVRLGREEASTNIRMEGAAMRGWEKNGWKKKTGPIKNLNLVKELYELYRDSKVKLIWVKGHDGIEMNELTDLWANKARENEGAENVEVELVSTE